MRETQQSIREGGRMGDRDRERERERERERDGRQEGRNRDGRGGVGGGKQTDRQTDTERQPGTKTERGHKVCAQQHRPGRPTTAISKGTQPMVSPEAGQHTFTDSRRRDTQHLAKDHARRPTLRKHILSHALVCVSSICRLLVFGYSCLLRKKKVLPS